MVLFKKYCTIIIFQIFIFSFQNQTNISYFSYINNNDNSIKNAIYIIRNREGNVNLDYDEKIILFHNNNKNLKKNFELIKSIDNNNAEEYFYIRDQENDLYLCFDEIKIDFISGNFLKEKDPLLWTLIPKINDLNQLIYYVQNKKYRRFWELSLDSKLILSNKTNISELDHKNEFIFNELYKKVEKKNSDLLEKEPIDAYIKYIDLSDEKLNRTGIHQIKKDEDNQELKYSIRSILENIPWIRKIFILMPNEKVKYFKPIEEINEKIVYVKDKDLLGFDSASNNIFVFNLFRMKQFGMSENFILMDDDCFIAKPLSKSDLFYEENGTIYPALITSDYYEMNKEDKEKRLKMNLAKSASSDPHSQAGFFIQQTRSFLFAYQIFGDDEIRFGKKLVEPAFSHNAIPVKMSDLEEIYNYAINKYKYANEMFTSLVRTNFDLQTQTLYMIYVKNQYDRKVSKISSAFYDLTQSNKARMNNKQLFVINTSPRNYRPITYENEKKVLSILFPKKTKYELDEFEIIELTKKMDNEKKKNISLFNDTITKKINSTISEAINDTKINASIESNQSNIINNTNYINSSISETINDTKINASIISNQTNLINDTNHINTTISEEINDIKINASIKSNETNIINNTYFIESNISEKIYYSKINASIKSNETDIVNISNDINSTISDKNNDSKINISIILNETNEINITTNTNYTILEKFNDSKVDMSITLNKTNIINNTNDINSSITEEIIDSKGNISKILNRTGIINKTFDNFQNNNLIYENDTNSEKNMFKQNKLKITLIFTCIFCFLIFMKICNCFTITKKNLNYINRNEYEELSMK